MLALTVAETLHEREEGGVKDVFKRNHPGGAIGAKARKIETREAVLETCVSSGEAVVKSDGMVTPLGL